LIFIEKTNYDLITKYIRIIKLSKSVEMLKSDNLPIEIINNVFIGSIGAAMNRQGLEEHQITHVIVAASGLKEFHPEVSIISE